MNGRRHFILGLLATGALCAASARAGIAPENPYTPIVTRNVFALVPIPTNPPVDLTPEVPPPKITPNGIMTLFGKLQVLFKVAGVAHPGQPPKDESYVLSEGDRQDDIEVQTIDEKSATITFNNHGIVQKLALVAGTASGGDAAPTASGLPLPGMARPGVAPIAGGSTAIGFGGRFGRTRPLPGASNPGAGGAPSLGAAAPTAGGAPQQEITPEQQIINMESQRAKWLDEGNPAAAIIPPTRLTSQVIGGDNGDSAPAPEVPMPGN